MIVGTLPEPEAHPHWQGILRLLSVSADRYAAEPWDADQVVWIVIEGRQIIAAFTTSITEEGDAEIVNVAGHRVAEWLPLSDEYVTMWAKLAGAARVTTKGRKGWQRLNAALGWVVTGRDGDVVQYEKVL